jgi:seryl-tRNA synthetase
LNDQLRASKEQLNAVNLQNDELSQQISVNGKQESQQVQELLQKLSAKQSEISQANEQLAKTQDALKEAA